MKVMLVLLILSLALISCQRSSEVLRIGIISPSIDHLPLSFAFDKGMLPSTNYALVRFSSGWELQEALIAKSVDMAIMPFTYAWNAASKGYPIKIVSFFERETDGIVASPKITSVAELEGKKVGVLKASSIDVLMQDLAHQEQLSYEPVYFRTPNECFAALNAGEVDAIVSYVPLIQKAAAKLNVIHWFGEDHKHHPCCDIVVNTEVLNKTKTGHYRKLLPVLTKVIDMIDARTVQIMDYVKQTYGLDDATANDALNHTAFILGLDDEGKAFEARMTDLSIKSGYQTQQIGFSEIYLNLP